MCAPLPVAIESPVTLRAELWSLRKGNRRSIAKRQPLTVLGIMAIHTSIVEAMRELDRFVVGTRRSCSTRRGKDLMAPIARL